MEIFEFFKKKKILQHVKDIPIKEKVEEDLKLENVDEELTKPYWSWPERANILNLSDRKLLFAESCRICIPMDNLVIEPNNLKEIRDELVKRGYRYDFMTGGYEKKCKSEYEKEIKKD